MKEVSIIISGFGNIGRSFAEVYEQKRAVLREKYGLDLSCKAVIEINGSAVSKDGLPLMQLVDHIKQGNQLESHPEFGRADYNAFDAINEFESGVLLECTPTNIETGEPGLSIVRKAIKHKWNVVLANKGPLINAFRELHESAEKAGVKLKISGAAAAALPTIDVGEMSLAGSDLLRFEGILNGTSNYILTRMVNDSESYDSALRKAQDLGIAESDPSLDVKGLDTANKTLIIANTLMGCDLTLNEISVAGITSIDIDQINEIKQSGRTIKLIGSAERT
ncbi:MAG: homoserine dehydrogenase, partial [bacterium]|nr:homoserine dehydrogenase [bacterium]